MSSEIRIEALKTNTQFDQAVALQDTVWSYEPDDRMTQKVFLLASHIGGQALGAYDGDTLAGYAMSLPGIRDGKPYLHSHHLAVLPQYRSGGVGRRLKLAQRDDAMARGIKLMEWTFDPLEIPNAHLNVARLGAVIRRYKKNFYGESTSPLHGGLPTDRVIAEWWLGSRRVSNAFERVPNEFEVEARVEVPAAIYAWKADPATRHMAREVQLRNSEALEAAFAAGLAVLGYERDAAGNGTYLLGKWDETPVL